MYGYEWTGQNGIYRLSVNSKIEKEIRPVFKEELDYFGFYKHWTYPDTDAPLLWAEGIRRYILNGTCVAEAIGGGFYTKPTIKIYTDNLTLEPIDIDVLWKENERLMLGLEKTSMDFIRKTHDKYEKKGMAFAAYFKVMPRKISSSLIGATTTEYKASTMVTFPKPALSIKLS